ncbi:MAG: CotH protein [Oscillospiraceae bacterium]|nr:CotH protein [Oscillospiraceae bacterium]
MVIAVLASVGMMAFSQESTDQTSTVIQPQYASKLFGSNKVVSINIKADKTEWENMLQNAQQEEYISCDVEINGTTFYSVGIRPKGNSSLTMVSSSDSDRYSFKLKFDEYIKGQTCFGLDTFVVNNIQGDATYMKEYLSYDIMKYIGVDTPLFAYTNIKVNDEDWGFYLALESFDESFVSRVYNTSDGNLYNVKSMDAGGGKANDTEQQATQNTNALVPTAVTEQNDSVSQQDSTEQSAQQGDIGGGRMGGGKSSGGSLEYTDNNTSSYSAIFGNSVLKSDEEDYQRVITAIKNLSTGTDLEKYFDVDKVLRYLAAHTVVVNLDSYVSNMQQNYYIYENEGKITILPWDYNLSFGGFQGGNASSMVNFPIDTPVSGVNLSERPLIAKLLEVDEYKQKYHYYLNQIVTGYFESGLCNTTITQVDSLINTYVKNDATAFYTYDQYAQSLPVLKELISLRAKSIKGQLKGTVPSTTQEQSSNSDKLISTGTLNLSALGSQGGRGGNNQMQTYQKDNSAQQDGNSQQDGLQQFQNGKLPSGEPPQGDGQDGGNRPQGRPPSFGGRGLGNNQQQGEMPNDSGNQNQMNKQDDQNQGEQTTNLSSQATSASANNIIMLLISVGLLIIGLIFVKYFRRSR